MKHMTITTTIKAIPITNGLDKGSGPKNGINRRTIIIKTKTMKKAAIDGVIFD